MDAVTRTLEFKTVPRRFQGVQQHSRLNGIDAFRTIAAVGTVWVHCMRAEQTERLGHLGRFAVPYFSFIAAWFMVSRLRSKSAANWLQFSGLRFERLYIPFLYWTAAYLFLRYLKQWTFGGIGDPLVSWSTVLSGSQPHLWFLPFLCAALIGSYPIMKLIVGHRRREVVAGIMLALLGVGITVVAPPIVARWGVVPVPGEYQPIVPTLVNWLDRFPAFAWGLSIGLLVTTPAKSMKVGWGIGAASIAVWLTALMTMVVTNHSGGLPQNVAGLALAGVALAPWPKAMLGWLVIFSTYSYGVYLNHMIFTEIVRAIREAVGVPRSFWIDLLRFGFTVVSSFALAIALRRFWLTRVMTP